MHSNLPGRLFSLSLLLFLFFLIFSFSSSQSSRCYPRLRFSIAILFRLWLSFLLVKVFFLLGSVGLAKKGSSSASVLFR